MRGWLSSATTVATLVLACAFFAAAQTDSQPAAPAPASTNSIQVPPGARLLLELEDGIDTKDARKGDKVEFSLARDLEVGYRTVLPAGTRVRGTVTQVKKPGMAGKPARLALHFDEVVLSDGTAVPIEALLRSASGLAISGNQSTQNSSGSQTSQGNKKAKQDKKKNEKDPSISGEGEGVGKQDALLVGLGAGQGALIGASIGGGRGAVYGGAIGAGIGLAEILLRRGPHLDLPPGTLFEVELAKPIDIPSHLAQRAPAPPLVASKVPGDDPDTTPVFGSDEPEQANDSAMSADSSAAPASSEATRDDGSAPADSIPDFPADDSAPASESEATTIDDLRPPVPGLPPPPTELPGESDYKLRVNVRLVLVEAFVRDDRGRTIDELKKEDFRVFEDGAEQEIRHFSRDELPLAVALVVDRSGSVAPFMPEIRAAAYDTLRQLKRGDRVALFTFAEDVDRLTDLTTDRRRVAESIARIRPGGGTNILDAIHMATQYLTLAAPRDRRAIILVSDNEATMRGFASQDRVIRQALENEVVVYSVKTPGQPGGVLFNLGTKLSGVGSVNKITRETGGEVFDVRQEGSIEAAMAAVVGRLRTRYTLGYQSSNQSSDGRYRSINVRLTTRYGQPERDYSIHARQGYYAPAEAVASQPQPTPTR